MGKCKKVPLPPTTKKGITNSTSLLSGSNRLFDNQLVGFENNKKKDGQKHFVHHYPLIFLSFSFSLFAVDNFFPSEGSILQAYINLENLHFRKVSHETASFLAYLNLFKVHPIFMLRHIEQRSFLRHFILCNGQLSITMPIHSLYLFLVWVFFFFHKHFPFRAITTVGYEYIQNVDNKNTGVEKNSREKSYVKGYEHAVTDTAAREIHSAHAGRRLHGAILPLQPSVHISQSLL